MQSNNLTSPPQRSSLTMINCNNQVNSSNTRSQVRGRLTDHIKSLLTHRYLVILASFLTNGIIFGVINSFGVLYVYLHKSFEGETKDAGFQTSLVGSILIGTTFACSALSSIITDKCGIRATSFVGGLLAALGMFASSFSTSIYQLYLTYGLLLGFGVSLCYAPSLVILGHYFTENLGLVNGIVTAGSSVFTMILPICLQQLLTRFSLYFALRLLSLFVALLMICALTFKEKHEYLTSSNTRYKIQDGTGNNNPDDYDSQQYPIANSTSHLSSHHSNHRLQHSSSSPSKKNTSSNHSYSQVTTTTSSTSDSCSSSSCTTRRRNLINYKIWKNPLYILWAISFPTALFGYFVPHFHLVKHASDILPGANNELLVTCIGATSGIGRVVFGQISDIQSVNPVVLQQVALLALGGSTMLFTVAKSYSLLLVLCAIFGLFDGCFVSLMGPVAYHLVGKEGASQAIGFVLGLSSIPFMVGPPLAGYMYDLNGDYFYAFLLAGLPPFIGALIMIPIIVIQRYQSRQLNQSLIVDSSNQQPTTSPTVDQHQSTINNSGGDCLLNSTQVDPLTSSLINDHLKSSSSQSTNHNLNHHNHLYNNHLNHSQLNHHHNLNQNNVDSHSSSSPHHLSNHLLNQQLNFNYIKSNQSPNQWINNEIANDLTNNLTNCPESVSLLTKSTNQPTVITCENNQF